MVYGQRAQIAELALKIPTSCPYRDQTAAGCLMSYGANVSETFRQAGNYVGRVLKAKSPPICRSTADQIRAGHQSQDSEGAPPRRSDWTIRRCRRADRVGSFRCTACVSLWHFAKIRRDDHKFGRYWRHSRLGRAFSPDQLGRK
jgi:hypothetical protein